MSTWPTALYVDKRQPVYSSALITWGIARFLHDILEQLEMQTRVTLIDRGSYFCIAIPSHFALSEAPYIRLLRQIRTAKHYEGLADDAFDYEEFRSEITLQRSKACARKEHHYCGFLRLVRDANRLKD